MSGLCRAARWLLLSLALCLAATAAQAQRVALIMANANYSLGRLANPPADAQLMESALKALGFKVVTLLNASQNQMRRAVRDFAAEAKGADVALVYYSGHAVQAAGENFLIPLNATIETEADYEVEALSVNHLLRQLELARPNASIIVLDACRDNPMASRTRSTAKGLARMDAPGGTMIAFATAPNSTASDDGLYARVLAAELRKPGQEIVDVFRNTTDEVRRLSNGKQVPRVSEVSLYGRLYLAGAPAAAAEPSTGPVRNQAEYAMANDGEEVLRRKLQTTTIDNLQRQADRGDAEAQYLVAVAKWAGIGLPEDLRGARQSMRLAAKAGFLRATMAYGNMLFDGVGGSANPDEAVDWWQDGARADFAPSLLRLSEYQRRRTDKARDLKAGYDHAQRAQALGHPDAAAELGLYHGNGLGMPVDPAKAAQLARTALARMLAAPADSELAYPPYAHDMAQEVIEGLKAGHLQPDSANELAELQAQWGAVRKLTQYTSKVNCGGIESRASLYVWHSREGPEPVKRQIDWLRAARSCEVPADVAEGFAKLFKIAKDNKVDYRELVVNAFGDDSKKPR